MQLPRRSFLKAAVSTGLGVSSLSEFARITRGVESTNPVRTSHEETRRAAEQAELSLLFRGTTVDECRTWQDTFRKRLAEMLGDFAPPPKWRAIEQSRHELEDHIRYEIVLQAEGLPAVPVYLLVPLEASEKKPAPGVLCLHGHGDHGHHAIAGRTDLPGVEKSIKGANYDIGRQFVRRGYVVAAPCMIPFGVRAQREKYGSDPCAVAFVRMLALGQVPIAANLRDLRWTIDFLQSRPEVVGERIGCAGLSYGGRMTMLTAAMDDRVRVAAPSGAFNLLQERISHRYSCGMQVIPGLLKYGDYSEIGSLIAPRPCVWEIGSRDGLISPKWATLFQERLERAYRALDAAHHLHIDRFTGGHRWNGEVAFRIFDQVLKA